MRVRIIALTLALGLMVPWLASARADEPQETVASLMERLIPRNQLQSYGPAEYPTLYRWTAPIRLSVVSRDENARLYVERETVGPLIEDFRQAANYDAVLSPYQQSTNVLLVIGTSPQDDFQFYAKDIHETSKDSSALSDLTGDAQPGTPPCYRNWRFVEGAVETAILYAPSPFQDEALSKKCVAVNFGVLVGLLGKPSDGQTITNIGNQHTLFTAGDKVALGVLYAKELDPSRDLNMATIERIIGEILSR